MSSRKISRTMISIAGAPGRTPNGDFLRIIKV